MKPFSLEEYLANPTKKLITRDGCDARIICTDVKSEKYQVVALVTKKGGQEILATFDTSGKYRSGYNSHLDLFFAPEKLKIERFDPNTLHPFDKVIVRNGSYDIWRANFFGYRNNKNPLGQFDCFGFIWSLCIPYNEETKHLVGTKEDCPDYYKWWEEQL